MVVQSFPLDFSFTLIHLLTLLNIAFIDRSICLSNFDELTLVVLKNMIILTYFALVLKLEMELAIWYLGSSPTNSICLVVPVS